MLLVINVHETDATYISSGRGGQGDAQVFCGLNKLIYPVGRHSGREGERIEACPEGPPGLAS